MTLEPAPKPEPSTVRRKAPLPAGSRQGRMPFLKPIFYDSRLEGRRLVYLWIGVHL